MLGPLTAFRKELERKANNSIRVETLYWIWDELERIEPTGESGDNYVARYRPLFIQSLEREQGSREKR